MRKLSAITLALALSSLVQAEPESDVSPIGKIDGMVSLPVTGIKAVESNGRIVFMSDSGRFVIDGTLYDAWSKKSLTSLDAIREASNTLDLSRLGLNMDDLNPLNLGEGKKKVVVFVDPRCPHCHELLKQALLLTKDYTFQILPVPVLGPDSERQVRQLGCARDKKAATAALLNGRIDNLEQDDACKLESMQRTLVTAQVLGIQGVPFMVASDGRISRGRPDDLAAWLEAH